MMERTTNALLSEIEELSLRTIIWLLCALSAQMLLNGLFAHVRMVGIGVPSNCVGEFWNRMFRAEESRRVCVRQYFEGHTGIAEPVALAG